MIGSQKGVGIEVPELKCLPEHLALRKWSGSLTRLVAQEFFTKSSFIVNLMLLCLDFHGIQKRRIPVRTQLYLFKCSPRSLVFQQLSSCKVVYSLAN